MLSKEDKVAIYREMVTMRLFEEKAQEMYEARKVGGFLHLYVGQEAVASGFTWPLEPRDYVIGAYREHGQALARCAEPKRVMAELFGKRDGVSGGHGGSMHLFDRERRFLGGTAIVGGGLPLAAGVGFAINYRDEDAICLCFFGDGAVNEGSFHETLNLASLWNLPILFVCENNKYGMGTAVERVSAVPNLYQRAQCYAMDVETVDGMDVTAVCNMAECLIKRVRNDRRPIFVEAVTYRFRGHSIADPGKYRTREEIDEWRKRDPVELFCKLLVSEGTLDPAAIEQIRAECAQVIDEAVVFAEASEPPPLDTLHKDVYMMPTLMYRQALNQALREEMQRDESVFVIGEEVAQYEGAYRVTEGLWKEFGDRRVRDTPIAEEVIVGVGVGAAMVGLRPVVELMTINFSLLAIDQIVNHAAKIHYMSGGQFAIPLVIRMPEGAGMQLGAQHSQHLEAWFAHVPGLKVVGPSNPYDAKGLLKSAIRDDNPVIFIENQLLYTTKGEVPEEDCTVPIGRAELKREGTDITLIAYLRMAGLAMKAAETLAQEGISAEVIDLRTLRPMDVKTIVESVRKTGRAVVVEEDWPYFGIGAQVVDFLQRHAFDHLDAPVLRVSSEDTPMPYSRDLELSALPDENKVLAAARHVLGHS